MGLNLVPPHGGELKPLLVEGEELEQERKKAKSLPAVRLTSRETSDLIMMALNVGNESNFDKMLGGSEKDISPGAVAWTEECKSSPTITSWKEVHGI